MARCTATRARPTRRRASTELLPLERLPRLTMGSAKTSHLECPAARFLLRRRSPAKIPLASSTLLCSATLVRRGGQRAGEHVEQGAHVHHPVDAQPNEPQDLLPVGTLK